MQAAFRNLPPGRRSSKESHSGLSPPQNLSEISTVRGLLQGLQTWLTHTGGLEPSSTQVSEVKGLKSAVQRDIGRKALAQEEGSCECLVGVVNASIAACQKAALEVQSRAVGRASQRNVQRLEILEGCIDILRKVCQGDNEVLQRALKAGFEDALMNVMNTLTLPINIRKVATSSLRVLCEKRSVLQGNDRPESGDLLRKLLAHLQTLLSNHQPEDLRLEAMMCLFPMLLQDDTDETAQAMGSGVEHLVHVLMGEGKSALQVTAAAGLAHCLDAQHKMCTGGVPSEVHMLSQPPSPHPSPNTSANISATTSAHVSATPSVAPQDEDIVIERVLASKVYMVMERVGGPTVLGFCVEVLLSAAEAGKVRISKKGALSRLLRLACQRADSGAHGSEELQNFLKSRRVITRYNAIVPEVEQEEPENVHLSAVNSPGELNARLSRVQEFVFAELSEGKEEDDVAFAHYRGFKGVLPREIRKRVAAREDLGEPLPSAYPKREPALAAVSALEQRVSGAGSVNFQIEEWNMAAKMRDNKLNGHVGHDARNNNNKQRSVTYGHGVEDGHAAERGDNLCRSDVLTFESRADRQAWEYLVRFSGGAKREFVSRGGLTTAENKRSVVGTKKGRAQRFRMLAGWNYSTMGSDADEPVWSPVRLEPSTNPLSVVAQRERDIWLRVPTAAPDLLGASVRKVPPVPPLWIGVRDETEYIPRDYVSTKSFATWRPLQSSRRPRDRGGVQTARARIGEESISRDFSERGFMLDDLTAWRPETEADEQAASRVSRLSIMERRGSMTSLTSEPSKGRKPSASALGLEYQLYSTPIQHSDVPSHRGSTASSTTWMHGLQYELMPPDRSSARDVYRDILEDDNLDDAHVTPSRNEDGREGLQPHNPFRPKQTRQSFVEPEPPVRGVSGDLSGAPAHRPSTSAHRSEADLAAAGPAHIRGGLDVLAPSIHTPRTRFSHSSITARLTMTREDVGRVSFDAYAMSSLDLSGEQMLDRKGRHAGEEGKKHDAVQRQRHNMPQGFRQGHRDSWRGGNGLLAAQSMARGPDAPGANLHQLKRNESEMQPALRSTVDGPYAHRLSTPNHDSAAFEAEAAITGHAVERHVWSRDGRDGTREQQQHQGRKGSMLREGRDGDKEQQQQHRRKGRPATFSSEDRTRPSASNQLASPRGVTPRGATSSPRGPTQMSPSYGPRINSPLLVQPNTSPRGKAGWQTDRIESPSSGKRSMKNLTVEGGKAPLHDSSDAGLLTGWITRSEPDAPASSLVDRSLRHGDIDKSILVVRPHTNI